MTPTFYTYIHSKPDGMPFYVGKGVLKRTKSLNANRNPYYLSTVEKYGAKNIIINKFECASEANAFELEMFVIESLKEKGVKLTNFTDGGEGASGRVATSKTRAKLSAWQIGKVLTAEHRAKISASQTGKTLSAEVRAKMSAWQIGKTLSEETKAKISASQIGRVLTAETRAKISAAQMGNTHSKGKTHSLETREKMRIAHVGGKNIMYGKKHSPETRAKISAAQKLRWLNAS